MQNINQHIEALIFVSKDVITLEEIKEALTVTFESEIEPTLILEGIQQVIEKYKSDDFAIEIMQIAGGYQFLTKGKFEKVIGNHLKNITKKQLSKATLETLSIVAYKQPVTKVVIESIRGVGCDYAMQKLLDKELIDVLGRSDAPGRPLLYGTSEKFMDYFGIKNLSDLPKPKDFKVVENEVGKKE